MVADVLLWVWRVAAVVLGGAFIAVMVGQFDGVRLGRVWWPGGVLVVFGICALMALRPLIRRGR